jgi:hypothetical protein
LKDRIERKGGYEGLYWTKINNLHFSFRICLPDFARFENLPYYCLNHSPFPSQIPPDLGLCPDIARSVKIWPNDLSCKIWQNLQDPKIWFSSFQLQKYLNLNYSGIFSKIWANMAEYGRFCQITSMQMFLSKKNTKQVEMVNARSVDIWDCCMADYGRLWNSNNFL